MRKPKAVIFDMDGVLMDSEPFHLEIEKNIFKNLGITVSPELHRTYLGVAGDYMYKDLKSRFGLHEPISELLELDESVRCDYFKHLGVMILNEGVLNLLHEIKSSQLKLAVATSSSPEMAMILLEKCGISAIFDTIVTTKDAGKSKPAPDVYLLAARNIGVIPTDCIVFEDSPNGLSAAKRAGMFCIGIETGSVDVKELSMADLVIKTFNGMTISRLTEIYALEDLAE